MQNRKNRSRMSTMPLGKHGLGFTDDSGRFEFTVNTKTDSVIFSI